MDMDQPKRYKVLLSAYACEPDKGSEPEVGWQWAMHLAKHCDVTVLTRSNNKEAIEQHLTGNAEEMPKFVYMDLSPFARKAKHWLKPGFLAMAWYYSAWQDKAYWAIKEMVRENDYDLVHHLTFASFRLPFGVTGHGLPSIIGPVGGCEEFPENLMPDRGLRVKLSESFRNILTRISTGLGAGMAKYHYASRVIASTPEMEQVFRDHGIDSLVMPQIGIAESALTREAHKQVTSDEIKLLFVGGVLCWKGLELAIQTLALLPETVSLTIIGSGPDEALLIKEVRMLNLTGRVHFLGRKPHEEVLSLYRDYDVFLYPSLHDSGSFTVLEAMAAGLPVICLDRGGPSMSVTSECGVVVGAQSREQTIEGLRDAVLHYMMEPDRIAVHGANARQRLSDHYEWQEKARKMLAVYDDVLCASPPLLQGGHKSSRS